MSARGGILVRPRRPREWAALASRRWVNPGRPSEATEQSKEIRLDDFISDFHRASPETRLAASVAEFSEILRNSYWSRGSSLEDVSRELDILPWRMRNTPEVRDLIEIVDKAKILSEDDS